MKILTISPPWAYFIIYGIPLYESVNNGDGSTSVRLSGKVILKDIENRTWGTAIRGRIGIHVGKKEYPILDVLKIGHKFGLAPMTLAPFYSTKLPLGAIIGEVDLVNCVTSNHSPWFEGPYGFVLRNPKVYKEPIFCKGRLGFWDFKEVE